MMTTTAIDRLRQERDDAVADADCADTLIESLMRLVGVSERAYLRDAIKALLPAPPTPRSPSAPCT